MEDNKELTSIQKARRKYEEKNKEQREVRPQFTTTVPIEFLTEINEFLKKHKITKVDLIYAGYYSLKEQREPTDKK